MDLVLAPLALKLDVLVTLEVKVLFVKIKKVLFKANLWYYKVPVINHRVLAIGTKEEDKTPPSFAPYKDTKVHFVRLPPSIFVLFYTFQKYAIKKTLFLHGPARDKMLLKSPSCF